MARELLIYGEIFGWSAREFVTSLIESDPQEETIVRVNSEGGSPEYGWGMISALKDHSETVKLKIDGQAHSMMAFGCCYFDEVEGLDVSQFCIHRAAYSPWYEDNYMSDMQRSSLIEMNKHLRAAFEAKVNVPEFEKIGKKTLDQIFSMDGREEVILTAVQAKKIGLISSIKKITPVKKAEIEASFEKIAAHFAPAKAAAENEESKKQTQNKPVAKMEMTITTLQAEHPAIFAEALAKGVAQERSRVNALLKFHDIDSATVVAAIASGKEFDMEMGAEFTAKAIANNQLGVLKKESPEAISTNEKDLNENLDGKDDEKDPVKALEKGVLAKMGLDKVQ